MMEVKMKKLGKKHHELMKKIVQLCDENREENASAIEAIQEKIKKIEKRKKRSKK